MNQKDSYQNKRYKKPPDNTYQDTKETKFNSQDQSKHNIEFSALNKKNQYLEKWGDNGIQYSKKDNRRAPAAKHQDSQGEEDKIRYDKGGGEDGDRNGNGYHQYQERKGGYKGGKSGQKDYSEQDENNRRNQRTYQQSSENFNGDGYHGNKNQNRQKNENTGETWRQKGNNRDYWHEGKYERKDSGDRPYTNRRQKEDIEEEKIMPTQYGGHLEEPHLEYAQNSYLPDLKSMMTKKKDKSNPHDNNIINNQNHQKPEINYNHNNNFDGQRQYPNYDRSKRNNNKNVNGWKNQPPSKPNAPNLSVQADPKPLQQEKQEPEKTGIPKFSDILGLFKDPRAFLEFQKTYGELINKMDEAGSDPEEMIQFAQKQERRLENEKKRAEKGLPIYLKRQEIMDQLIKNKFSIVVGDTGCGKSTQLPQYMFEHYEQKEDSKILWVLPRKLPTLSLSQRVCDEMEITLGQEIGYEVPNKKVASPNTRLKFITDTVLINELIAKRAEIGPEGKIKLNYSVIVLDEVHERNLYTDILLAALKDIAQESEMKMLVTSATINEATFEKYFDTKAIQVKGRPYPVEIEYNPLPDNFYPITHVANNVFRVVKDMEKPGFNYKGHILVFTSGVDDIIKTQSKLIEMFEESDLDINNYEILPLHGLLAPDEQQAVFTDIGKIKIILSTRIAETALTINGVRVVIDIGYDKETRYDSIKRMTITENKSIAQSSAIQRSGRAGRTSPGMCIRLYSEKEFEELSRNKVSEIQRMNLGKVILKLKALGVASLRQFDFVEKPDDEVLAQTIEHLMELGALATQNESLTLIGKAMLKLETDPDFSKVIIEGLRKDCVQEIIEIIAMIGVNPRLYKRGFDDDTKEAADKKKLGFCHEKGDLITLLKIYRFCVNMNRQEREKWCKKNYFSSHAIHEAHRTVKDLNKNLGEVKNILSVALVRRDLAQDEKKEGTELSEEEQKQREKQKKSEEEDNILKCFLTAFYPNVCLYTNIPRVGYTLLRDNVNLRVHGASSLALVQEYPKYLFCIDINKTNYNNSKLVSVMQQPWLDELFFNYQSNPRLKFLANSYAFSHSIISRLSRPILGYFAYNKLPEIKQLSDSPEISFYPELKEEKLHIYTSLDKKDTAQKTFEKIIDQIVTEFEDFTKEVPITLKTRGVFKSGGEIKEILLADETLTFSYDGFDTYYTQEKLTDLFAMVGEVVSVFQEIDKDTNLSRGTVTMKSSKDVHSVLSYYTQYRIDQYGDALGEIRPSITPICYTLNSAAKRALRIKIEWFVGESQCSATIRYSDSQSADEAYQKIDALTPLLDGQPLIVNGTGKRVNILSVRRAAKDKKQLIIDGLRPKTDSIDIERMLKDEKIDKGFVNAFVFRNELFGRDVIDELPSNMYTEMIKDIIVKEIEVDESAIYRIEPHIYTQRQSKPGDAMLPTEFRRRVEVDVFDLDIARKIITYLDSNSSFKDLTRGKIHCILTFSRRFALRWPKYRVIQKELNALVDKFREDKGSGASVFIDDRKQSNMFDKQAAEVGIRVTTKDPMTLDECCNAITPIVWGAPFYLKTFSQCRKAEVQSVKESIAKIEKAHEVTIEHDKKRRQLKVFGPATNRENALRVIQELFEEAPKGFQKVKVSFRYHPVRHILENNGGLLVEVERKFGVRINYSLLFKEITIYGSAERVLEAEKEVTALVKARGNKSEITEEECPICLESFNDGYRLQACGHKYCFSCLETELNEKLNNNPDFPILCSQCFGEDQKKPICLRDLTNIFTSGTISTLWERSMEVHLRKNQDIYFRCFTPNCPQIFKKINEEKSFSCDYCLKSYCKKCQKKAHGQMTCEENEKDTVMEALKGKEAKECPKCRFIIEKDGGCSKMECIMCRTVFCWLCRDIFDNEGQVHAHLDRVHRAYG